MKKFVLLAALLLVSGIVFAQEAEAPITGEAATSALRLLDQATARLELDRQGHLLVQNALRTLETYITEHEKTDG